MWFRMPSWRMMPLKSWRVAGAALLAAVALAFVACGGGGSGAKSSPLGTVDQANKTVDVNLNITGFNFDGYSKGQMTVTVPQGWKVNVHCSNQTSIPHSCAVVADANSTSPVFPGAASPNPDSGLSRGQSAIFSFTATNPGHYRIVCLVPGHESDGMWDSFNVISAGSPSVST